MGKNYGGGGGLREAQYHATRLNARESVYSDREFKLKSIGTYFSDASMN